MPPPQSKRPKPRRKAKASAKAAPPDPREQRKLERAERTRHAILDAAAEVIAQVGATAATVELVAQQAGYSVGSLYNYFKSKNELIESLVHKLFKDAIEALDRPLPSSLTARQRVEALVLRQLEFVERSRGWLLSLIQDAPMKAEKEGDVATSEQAYLMDGLSEIFAVQVREATAEGAARALDPRLGAVFIASTIRGIMVDWARHGGDGSATDLAPLIVELVFDGIGSGERMVSSD